MKKFHELLKAISDTRTDITKAVENEELVILLALPPLSLTAR